MIIIPKKILYELPEGDYRATLLEVIETEQVAKGTTQKVVRLVFGIISLRHPRYEYRAGKNYPTTRYDKLAADLDSWLGDELVDLMNVDNEVTIEALKTLVGRDAEFEIVHIPNGSFKTAFRHIVRLFPPGELVKEPIAAA